MSQSDDSDTAEEGKFSMATGGITQDEVKFLEALKMLGIDTKIETPQDLMKIAQAFGTVKMEQPQHVLHKATEVKVGYQYPKLSVFYGDVGKGELNWNTLKYEVEATIKSNVFKAEQILLGVRRAVKGSAGDVIRRLGSDVTLDQVLEKLDNTYGSIESRESIMRKFYSTQQQLGESVASFAA
jgi:hypothetical protein